MCGFDGDICPCRAHCDSDICLSERGRVVYAVAGLSNADIAQELIVSTNTIKTHVKSIYCQLNVKSRDETPEVASELNLL